MLLLLSIWKHLKYENDDNNDYDDSDDDDNK